MLSWEKNLGIKLRAKVLIGCWQYSWPFERLVTSKSVVACWNFDLEVLISSRDWRLNWDTLGTLMGQCWSASLLNVSWSWRLRFRFGVGRRGLLRSIPFADFEPLSGDFNLRLRAFNSQSRANSFLLFFVWADSAWVVNGALNLRSQHRSV